MLVCVYRLRHKGEKLPSPELVRHNRVQGTLAYYARAYRPEPRHRVMLAVLLQADGEHYVVPPLDHAWVAEIRGDGLLISGTEVCARGRGMKNIRADYYRQSWWCVPTHLDRPPQPSPQVARTLAELFNEENDELD